MVLVSDTAREDLFELKDGRVERLPSMSFKYFGDGLAVGGRLARLKVLMSGREKIQYVISQYHVGAKPIAGAFWNFELVRSRDNALSLIFRHAEVTATGRRMGKEEFGLSKKSPVDTSNICRVQGRR